VIQVLGKDVEIEILVRPSEDFVCMPDNPLMHRRLIQSVSTKMSRPSAT